MSRIAVQSDLPRTDSASMLLDGTALFWIPFCLVAGVGLLACLRVIGHEYYMAVRWHNLKVEVHRLRIEQHRRIKELAFTPEDLSAHRGADGAEPSAGPAADDAGTDDVDVAAAA